MYRTTDRQFQVVECRGCRLLRLHPQPSPSDLHRYYPPDYWFEPEQESAADRLAECYRRLVLRDHVRFVRRAVERSGETGPVLDVGCGGGLFLRMLKEHGLPVVGLDFSLDAAAMSWRGLVVPAVCCSLSQAPFPPETFAAVTMFHVLEHLYDPRPYLESAREVLKPAGRLIVQVPNAACWQFLMFGENWSGVDIPRHLFNFRAHDLEVLLDQCGFEVVREKFFSARDNPAGFATSLAPWLDPMVRRIRRVPEGPELKLCKNLLYFALLMVCLPFTLVEAACRAGSTVMVEARKKS